jgi:hypothetical protein
MFMSERAVDGMVLHLRGSGWALDASLEKLREVVIQRKPVHNFTLTDFDFDVTVASIVIRVLQVNASFMESLTLHDCTGNTELVVAVAMTMDCLEKMVVSIGRLAPAASTPLMHALGVGLQISPSLKELVIQSGSNVFFTLDPEAAESLEVGLGNARLGAVDSKLERFTLKCCRFAEPSAVRSLASGLQHNRGLRHVNLQSCYTNNGHPLDDASLSRIIQALEHNPNLSSLNVSGNKCLQESVAALAQLMIRTPLERLNLSSQVIETDYNEYLDVSLLVGALARTTTLKSLDLRFNKLGDEAMAYLAAALAQNRSLEYLGLASNKIQNTGISIVASKIAEMKGLRHLVLTNNPFDDTATLELAEALDASGNWTLEAVECGGPGRKIKHD